MRRIVLAALSAAMAALPAAMAGPASAQGRPPEAGPPVAATPADGPPPQLDRAQSMAAKLTGLVGFVNAACPELRGDTERLHAAVRRLGVEPEGLQTGVLKLATDAYRESYGQDVPANCRRAIETFGPESKIVPDLIARR